MYLNKYLSENAMGTTFCMPITPQKNTVIKITADLDMTLTAVK
jgi:hypothetical protein